MKLFVTFTAFAAVATVVLPTASANECNLAKLVPLATGANAGQCTKDSGFQFVPPSVPTTDKIPKLCGSTACKGLLAELKAAAPSECTISLLTPALKLYADVVTPIEKACESLAPAPTTSTPPAPAPSTTSVVPAPAPAPASTPAPRPTEPLVVRTTTTAAPKPQC